MLFGNLAISVIFSSCFTITLFTSQFAQYNTHPQVTLNNSTLTLERTPCILGVTFEPHFKLNALVKSEYIFSRIFY